MLFMNKSYKIKNETRYTKIKYHIMISKKNGNKQRKKINAHNGRIYFAYSINIFIFTLRITDITICCNVHTMQAPYINIYTLSIHYPIKQFYDIITILFNFRNKTSKKTDSL